MPNFQYYSGIYLGGQREDMKILTKILVAIVVDSSPSRSMGLHISHFYRPGSHISSA
jgi:hypothetical protein